MALYTVLLLALVYLNYCSCVLYNHLSLFILLFFFSFFVFLCVVFSPHVFFIIFLPHYGNEERADLTTEQPDELHFHGLSRLLVTSHCLFSFSVYLVKNCDNKKRLLLLLANDIVLMLTFEYE